MSIVSSLMRNSRLLPMHGNRQGRARYFMEKRESQGHASQFEATQRATSRWLSTYTNFSPNSNCRFRLQFSEKGLGSSAFKTIGTVEAGGKANPRRLVTVELQGQF